MKQLSRINILILILFTLLLSGCPSNDKAPSSAPANVTATGGDGFVVVNWDTKPGLTYWIFYKKGSSVSLDDHDRTLSDVKPPYFINNLSNGTQYAFTVTSSNGTSKVGPFSPSLTATPHSINTSIPWTIGPAFTAYNLNSIAFGNNTYVTVGNAATIYSAQYDYLKPGGVTDTGWVAPTTSPITTVTNLTSVIYNGTKFVALGDDGSIITSTDANTWNAATAITSPPVMNALAYHSGNYVAVGNSGAIYTNTSSGISNAWVSRTPPTTNNLYGISYVNGRFIAVGAVDAVSAMGTLLTSPDGITWTAQTSNSGDALRHVAYGANNYVAVGDNGAIVSSPDATTWSAQTAPTAESFRSIIFGRDSQFIAVGTAGLIAYSLSGADGSWAVTNAGIGFTDNLNSIVSNWVYIATGAAGANVSVK